MGSCLCVNVNVQHCVSVDVKVFAENYVLRHSCMPLLPLPQCSTNASIDADHIRKPQDFRTMWLTEDALVVDVLDDEPGSSREDGDEDVEVEEEWDPGGRLVLRHRRDARDVDLGVAGVPQRVEPSAPRRNVACETRTREVWGKLHSKTRMYSRGCLPRKEVSLGGSACLPMGGVSAWGVCPGVYTSPHKQNDWQTSVKTLTFLQLRLRTVRRDQWGTMHIETR